MTQPTAPTVRVAPHKIAGTCPACGGWVEAGKGLAAKLGGVWVTGHTDKPGCEIAAHVAAITKAEAAVPAARAALIDAITDHYAATMTGDIDAILFQVTPDPDAPTETATPLDAIKVTADAATQEMPGDDNEDEPTAGNTVEPGVYSTKIKYNPKVKLWKVLADGTVFVVIHGGEAIEQVTNADAAREVIAAYGRLAPAEYVAKRVTPAILDFLLG